MKMSMLIEISEYQHDWPLKFKDESGRILDVFGNAVESIHHIGSTSIPYMSAKPVIDILVVIKPETQVTEFYSDMSGLGYDCRGECLDAPIPGTPGRYYFRKDINGMRHFHVHVCHSGHFQIVELLALRDFLREHPTAAEEYGTLKSYLAEQFMDDNFGYMKGKDAYIKQLISRAHTWLQSASEIHPS